MNKHTHTHTQGESKQNSQPNVYYSNRRAVQTETKRTDYNLFNLRGVSLPKLGSRKGGMQCQLPAGDRLYRTCVNLRALSLISSRGAITDLEGVPFPAGSPLTTWGPTSRVSDANDALQCKKQSER
jgi:hypothetical protein